jgi:hypothetical protein
VLWIWIRIEPHQKKLKGSIPDPHQREKLDPDPHQSDKLDPDPHHFADGKPYGKWAYLSSLSRFFSLYLEARIRIRIKVKGTGRIQIKVTNRIRIRIKVMRIRNTV